MSVLAGSPLDIAVGGLEAIVVLVLVFDLRRSRGTAPLKLVLTAFFALRGGERLTTGLSGSDTTSLSIAVDLGVSATLLVLLFTATTVFERIDRTWRSARRREREYERALTDYRRLARHRLANPVSAILGSARAIHEMPNLDLETRRALVAAIIVAAERLEMVTLDPQAPLEREERDLRPVPHVDGTAGEEASGASSPAGDAI